MPLKFYEEREKTRFNLIGLCRQAGFKDMLDPHVPLEDTEFIKNMPTIMVNPNVPWLFYKALAVEGVELFSFKSPWHWQQENQRDFEGLSYFCYPNKERLKHEADLSARHQSGFYVMAGEVYAVKAQPEHGPLYLHATYPDKWSHMALEILLRYAKQD